MTAARVAATTRTKALVRHLAGTLAAEAVALVHTLRHPPPEDRP